MNKQLSEIYLENSNFLRELPKGTCAANVCWRSPSNIALVKYWGKKDFQIPMNPSLSFSLSQSYTETEVYYEPSQNFGSLEYFFEDDHNISFENRVKRYFENLSIYLPFIKELKFVIKSKNTFPHSSGIASSASAMSALALCLCSIENLLLGTLKDNLEFYNKASFLSRLGSGSACRSIYPGYSIWGSTNLVELSNDESATPINDEVSPVFNHLCDTILIVSRKPKSISSSIGHKLMEQHPFANSRLVAASGNLKLLLSYLKNGDESGFTSIVKNEALMLHSLMMSSNPGYILMKPETINIINLIEEFALDTKLPLSFTLDAGPNVHLIYSQRYKQIVDDFIKLNIMPILSADDIIYDAIGNGPQQIELL